MDPDYKKQWHEEHEMILRALNLVSELGVLTEAGSAKLLEAKALLLGHLKSEEANLYPVLQRGAEKDPALKRTLDLFSLDMEAIAGMAMFFFKRFEEDPKAPSLPEKFAEVCVMLRSRVSREEAILIKEYEKLAG